LTLARSRTPAAKLAEDLAEFRAEGEPHPVMVVILDLEAGDLVIAPMTRQGVREAILRSRERSPATWAAMAAKLPEGGYHWLLLAAGHFLTCAVLGEEPPGEPAR
jgi:hypothetical protein